MTRTYLRALAVIATLLSLTASNAPASTIVDLKTAGATATETAQNGGDFIVQQTTIESTGSGVIDSFVRLRAEGRNTSEQGYNTDARPVQFDEKNSPTVTHSLLLSDVPVVNIGGTDYRQFLLDINEGRKGDKSLLSLNQVQIFLANTNVLTNAVFLFDTTPTTPPVITFFDPSSVEVFRMNNSDPAFLEIQLNGALNPKSKPGDMFLYVQDAAFQAVQDRPFVYLYSQFGTPPGAYATNGRFEEWAVLKNVPNPVPEPTTVALALTGLGTLGLASLRRRHRSESASA